MLQTDKKAIEIENIPIKIIKMAAEYILPVSSNLFSKCILKGIFPSPLKTAEITPIHKKESLNKTTNYRSISVLSPFSKIFEKIIHKRLENYFTSCNTVLKE